MTQDQYSQARVPGYAVPGDAVPDDAVPDDENEEYGTGEAKPMTRFQKVASALRGGGTEPDEQDQTAAYPGTSREGDYWEEPAASATERDDAVAVTNPDVPVAEPDRDPVTRQDEVTGQASPDDADYSPTQPDMFGTTTHAGNGVTSTPYPEGQAGAATIADVPVSDVPASDVHPAAASAGTESRPGEAAGTLGDFSDLTYGNLLPDAAQYTAQWQQVQFKFVDDPHASVTEAAEIIAQVTARLEAAIAERQRAIAERQRAITEQQRLLRDRWGEDTNADTEVLRETLRMYRTFLEQLIGPRAG